MWRLCSPWAKVFGGVLLALMVAAPRFCLAEEPLKYVPKLGVWADSFVFEDGRAGLRVVRIDLNAPAMYLRDLPSEFAGPRRYLSAYRDVILAVDGQRVTRVDELNAMLYRAGEESRLTIYNRSTKRDNRFYVTLP
ncbi:MAG: hypothetical protein JNM18_10495 [Planctomycetaceae bacterium]|nr:hypothetical protein [Planctomycetaceae bacterium]